MPTTSDIIIIPYSESATSQPIWVQARRTHAASTKGHEHAAHVHAPILTATTYSMLVELKLSGEEFYAIHDEEETGGQRSASDSECDEQRDSVLLCTSH